MILFAANLRLPYPTDLGSITVSLPINELRV